MQSPLTDKNNINGEKIYIFMHLMNYLSKCPKVMVSFECLKVQKRCEFIISLTINVLIALWCMLKRIKNI